MSSNEIAIKVESLGKRFEIYDQPGDRLKQFVWPRVRRFVGQKSSQQYFQEFWALKNVTFEVKKGQTFGVVGRNGSGKSTLLQIICGTLNPTSGRIGIHGRVAALLELGSGFNPEFTGRENVYLNASVLGLSNREIDDRFEEIVKFADIGEFINQPTKTYSSGMMVRLAFAVIAHVDADILVVDEALAVGDAVFTQKCMRFIREFQQKGTLLFVSHDMGAIQNICESAMWLSHGKVMQIGDSKTVAEAYLQHTLQEAYGDKAVLASTSDDSLDTCADIAKPSPALLNYESVLTYTDNLSNAKGWSTGSAEIIGIELTKLGEGAGPIFIGGEVVCLKIHALSSIALDQPILGFILKDRLGQDLFGENTLAFTSLKKTEISANQKFFGEFIFRLPMLPNGEYMLMASVANGTQYDNVQHHHLHNVLIINVSSSKVRYGLVGIAFDKVKIGVIDD